MDSRLMELWGNFLLQAAKNQQFLEQFLPGYKESQEKGWDFQDWVSYFFENLSGSQPFAQNIFGLEQMNEYGQQSLQAWQKSWEEFYRQWQEMIQIFGLVPQGEYQEQVQENEQLRQKLQEKEQRIERLEQLLEQKASLDLEQSAQELSQLFEQQNRQFSHFVQTWEKMWMPRDSDTQNQDSE
ncbi:MAG: hypothetical protein ACLFM3_08040 [Desulfohalobiaceae bacterium]